MSLFLNKSNVWGLFMYSILMYDVKKSRGDELEKLLNCYFYAKGLRCIIRRFSTFSEVIRCSYCADIVFMNIEDGDVQGMNAGGALLRIHPDIYLYVMSDRYTFLDYAMDLKAFRYLENPVDVNRLFGSLDIIVEGTQKISFMSEHIPVTLDENEVVCIYTSGRKTCVLTDSGGSYPTTSSIKEWLTKTQRCESFVSPHYSYIVNMKYVNEFDGHVIILKCKTGKILKVYPSQRKIGEFRQMFYSRIHN